MRLAKEGQNHISKHMCRSCAYALGGGWGVGGIIYRSTDEAS